MNASTHAPGTLLDPVTLDLLMTLASTLADAGRAAPQALYQHSSALCAHLLVQLSDSPAPEPERLALSPWQTRRAKQLMLEQMSGSPCIADIARACSLSRSHFSRAFKKTTGQAPRDWLLQARLERAKALLADSAVSIAQVGLECGFADQSHFTRVFTRCMGHTPFTWRRALAQGITLRDNAAALTS